MRTETTYGIWPRNLDFEKVFDAIAQFAAKRGLQQETPTFFTVRIDPFETVKANSIDEFRSLFKTPPTFEHLYSLQRFAKKEIALEAGVSCHGNMLTVSVESNDPDIVTLMQGHVKSEFDLRKPPVPPVDSNRATYPQPRIFLGRHFDERAAAIAQTLKTFLALLAIEVVEAEAYSARPIPVKVELLIDEQEIYIGLVTKNPDHDWITAELAYARGKGKHVMLIVEEGASFDPTILGKDFEQIRFSGDAIEQASVKLLQEFRSIGLRIT